MNDNLAKPSASAEIDLARGLEMIGEAFPAAAATPDDDGPTEAWEADEAYPSGLFGSAIAIVLQEPLRALVWSAGVGITIWLLTSK